MNYHLKNLMRMMHLEYGTRLYTRYSIYIYIYIYVWKLNQTVLELDVRAVKFLFFLKSYYNPFEIVPHLRENIT